ncbi:uncharacterized protein [Diabrotica undecimpunctata]|uniref:uncharacterized protein n=1 Tax=Diabrotica undecimpunctata TaxID=50387 RepID=UPI003B63D28B
MLQFIVFAFLNLLCEFSLGQDLTHIEDIKVLSELPLDRLLTIQRGFKKEDIIIERNNTEEQLEGREFPHALALQGKPKSRDRGGYGGGGGSGGHSQPSYYYEEYYEKENKSNKIQSIFQLSVTSLAFLAFGGYLLCLLIHAIKAKQNTTTTNTVVTQALATFLANRIKKTKNQNRFRKRKKNLKIPARPNVVVKIHGPTRNLKLQKKPNNNNKNNVNRTLNAAANVHKLPTYVSNKYVYKHINNRRSQRRSKREIIGSVGGYIVYDDMYYGLLQLSEAYTKYHTIDYIRYNNTMA